MQLYIRRADGTDETLVGARSIIEDKGSVIVQFERNKEQEFLALDVKEIVVTRVAA